MKKLNNTELKALAEKIDKQLRLEAAQAQKEIPINISSIRTIR